MRYDRNVLRDERSALVQWGNFFGRGVRMEEVAGRGAPPSQPPARSMPSPAAPDLEPSASATAAAASTSVDRPFRTTQPTAPAPGKYSGLALPIGPVPGAMPNKMSREAAAPPSAAPPRSFLRSIFARALVPSLDVRTLRRRRAGAAGSRCC